MNYLLYPRDSPRKQILLSCSLVIDEETKVKRRNLPRVTELASGGLEFKTEGLILESMLETTMLYYLLAGKHVGEISPLLLT